jgi:HD-like signal output (HDOD) protein
VALYEKLSPARVEEAFLAGMLHDVGKVVFATRPAAAADDPAASLAEATAQMEAHHAEVGAYLLGLWGFPNSIVETVAFHHSPSQSAVDGLNLPRLIHIADRLVHQRGAESAGPSERGLEPELLETLGLADHWPAWVAALDSLDLKTAA